MEEKRLSCERTYITLSVYCLISIMYMLPACLWLCGIFLATYDIFEKVGVKSVRPELVYVLLLYFTFASSIGVGYAGCAEFSCSHSAEFSFLPVLCRGASGQKSQVQVL